MSTYEYDGICVRRDGEPMNGDEIARRLAAAEIMRDALQRVADADFCDCLFWEDIRETLQGLIDDTSGRP